MRLEELESILKPLVRRYTGDKQEMEDFEQISRLTAWQILERDPSLPKSYVIQAIKNKLADELSFKNAKKRNNGKKPISLDATLSSDDERSLKESIGEDSEPLLIEESMEKFIDGLKKRFGLHYIRSMKRDKRYYKEKVRGIVRTVIEEIHGISISDIPEKVNYKFFVESGLQRFLWTFYRNSAFDAVMDAYPNEIIPWNFKKKPNNFWSGEEGYERAVHAVEWFCKKREINELKDCRKIDYNSFREEGLGGMLQKRFNYSALLALKTKFLKLKPWQTKYTSPNYFDDKNNQRESINCYLMENGVPSLESLTPEEVYDYGLRTFVSKKSLSEEGLRALLKRYDGSVYRTFSSLFSEQILPWTLHSVKEPWRENPKETGANAISWLFDKYLKLPLEEIPDYASCDLFWRIGFSGIMTNRSIGYSSSPYRAVNSAYPDRFSREDFKRSRWDPSLKLDLKNFKRDQK